MIYIWMVTRKLENFKPKLSFDLSFYCIAFSLAVLAFSFFYNLSSIPIRIWDEARLANSALHMYEHGLSLVVYHDNAPDMWSTKPPLMIWLQAISLKLLGINEAAIRLPSAIASFLTGLYLLYISKKEFKDYRIGVFAILVYATMYSNVYIHGGRTGDYDAPLIFFLLVYSYSFFRYLQTRNSSWVLPFGICLIFAALTKSVAGLLFLPGLALYTFYARSIKLILFNYRFYLVLFAFLIFVGGYYLLREGSNPGYLKAVWENELGGRYLSTLEEHKHPFFHYIKNIFTWRNPYWAIFIVPSFVLSFFIKDMVIRKFTRFNLILASTYLLIISLSETKLEWYDLPLNPLFAIQIAIAFAFVWNLLKPAANAKWWLVFKRVVRIFIFFSLFIIPFSHVSQYILKFKEQPWDVEPHKLGYSLKKSIDRKVPMNGHVIVYQGYNSQIRFYIRKLNILGYSVRLQDSFENLKPGEHLVASEHQVIMAAENLGFKKVKEEFGCIEFIVTP